MERNLARAALALLLLSLLTFASTTSAAKTTEKQPSKSELRLVDAERSAAQNPKLNEYLKQFKRYSSRVTKETVTFWQISYFADGKEIAQVKFDRLLGRISEVWTGPQVAWSMARGREGAFGRELTEAWIWLPLMALFFIPFFNFRKPFRLLHLDLLVLLAFSLSHYFFNRGEIDVSVPLVYPVLVYLLVRMLLAGYVYRLRGREQRTKPQIPLTWMVALLVLLISFRVSLNVIDSNVIDVGYAGVVGADRITSDFPLYGLFPKEIGHGDTYGPVNYYAYVPFELARPWHGTWDRLPAAHAAAIFFDLATIFGLFLIGYYWRRGPPGVGLRGGDLPLAVTLAYAWAAYPYTLFVLNSNANDSLIAMLLVYGFLAAHSAAGRAVSLALATATKFAALALAPLWMFYRSSQRARRQPLYFAAAFLLVVALVMTPILLDTSPSYFWQRTLGYQIDRDSPFSIWGMYPQLNFLQIAVAAAVAAMSFIVTIWPRQKDRLQLAAFTAAVLIAVQLLASHWFYLYIVWFFPFVVIALFAPRGSGGKVVASPDG